MTATDEPTATMEIHRTHWATLDPVISEVRDLLSYTVVEFEPGGPTGE